MYSTNLKNKFDITLKAISSTDKVAKFAKNFSCINKEKIIYPLCLARVFTALFTRK